MSIYALITVSNDVISEVRFYDCLTEAVYELNDLLESLDLSTESASIYSPRGIVLSIGQRSGKMMANHHHGRSEEIFIMANPVHSLGFMVVGGPNEPIGFRDPVKALYYLEKNRKEMGNHIDLYQVTKVEKMKVKKLRMEEYAAQKGNLDFEHELIFEYLETK